jgi:hypothetical protein
MKSESEHSWVKLTDVECGRIIKTFCHHHHDHYYCYCHPFLQINTKLRVHQLLSLSHFIHTMQHAPFVLNETCSTEIKQNSSMHKKQGCLLPLERILPQMQTDNHLYLLRMYKLKVKCSHVRLKRKTFTVCTSRKNFISRRRLTFPLNYTM